MPMIMPNAYPARSGRTAAGGLCTGLIHQGAHALDRRVQTAKDRFANQEMANVQLPHIRDGRNSSDIVIAQTMAGMTFKAQIIGQGSGTS
jgi:hypothetical protein